jgi:hypothetical protein
MSTTKISGNALSGKTLTIAGGTELVLTNVQIGEVFVSALPDNYNPVKIDIKGSDTFNFDASAGLGNTIDTTINLEGNSIWYGTISTGDRYGNNPVFITGSGTFDNNGASDISYSGGFTTIDSVVGGTGSFTVSNDAILEFGKAVGANQTINVLSYQAPGTLVVDKASTFAASINLTEGLVELNGIAKADSYSFMNDILSIYNGKNIVDTLRLSILNPSSYITGIGMPVPTFGIDKTANGIMIYSSYGSGPIVGDKALTLHT